ncbi:hypothetical protein NP233_g8875 [Leucocoprinus birnbaumii]|uniref:O-methylsterigmatocystin oxidoreductase n=1 Tax=Leucocoprinus birnbaumii TaxID=56174 RepID=A0AAD5YTB3_9AGAR|nr:hypothetical protein NP233_g8875 [Leucocoprinus birnbaumii]
MGRAYMSMGERLGTKILYLEAFGQSIVVLNDSQMARDLLDKRSAIYSSRPRMNMLMDVVGVDYLFGSLPYGEEWRSSRRLFQQYYTPSEHRPRTEENDSLQHIKDCIGGYTISSTYGCSIRKHNDPALERAEESFTALVQAAAPGRFLVDIIPALKYVPEWFPGAKFKQLARKWREICLLVRDEPFTETKKAVRGGTVSSCFVTESFSRNNGGHDSEVQEFLVKCVAAQVYLGASETTFTAIATFILAMLLHPRVQKLVQQEIDAVVGRERLPEFSDRPHLPYLSAVFKEVLRWNTPFPLGIPHLTTEEDTYLGYRIPKGSIVMANAFAMLHDEEVFKSPEEFIPERYLKEGKIDPGVPDPEEFATFGFGRRTCPGGHIAMSNLFIMASSIVSIFDISPELDANGCPIEVVPQFRGNAITSSPLPFPCKLTPRQGVDVERLLKDYMDFEMI